MMESIEIKSKRNIRRKQYRKHLHWKKEMTTTLGFSFGRLFFKKEFLWGCVCVFFFKETLIVPAGKWVKFLKMAGS